MTMTDLKGDDWVLVKDDKIVLDHYAKPLVFETKAEADGFKKLYGTLAQYEAIQVSTLRRH